VNGDHEQWTGMYIKPVLRSTIWAVHGIVLITHTVCMYSRTAVVALMPTCYQTQGNSRLQELYKKDTIGQLCALVRKRFVCTSWRKKARESTLRYQRVVVEISAIQSSQDWRPHEISEMQQGWMRRFGKDCRWFVLLGGMFSDVIQQYNLVLAKRRWHSAGGRVINRELVENTCS